MGCGSSLIPHQTSVCPAGPKTKFSSSAGGNSSHFYDVTVAPVFLYIGQPSAEFSQAVTHIKVHPSVKVIRARAFENCRRLINIELNEGLELIEDQAFKKCRSLQCIEIPSTVQKIGQSAFYGCWQLTDVELHEGLEHICRGAFSGCWSLKRIKIPSSVKEIHPSAFRKCHSLGAIEFCEEINTFMSELLLQDLWNHGVSEHSLMTFSFLASRNIPERLGMLKEWTWKANVHDMLKRIPSIIRYMVTSSRLDNHFDYIDSKLEHYEWLENEVAPLLELAIWKSFMLDKCGPDIASISSATKLQHHINCGATVIVPLVLSFL